MKGLIALLSLFVIMLNTSFSQNMKLELMEKKGSPDAPYIDNSVIERAVDAVDADDEERLKRGVSQIAVFWQPIDGDQNEFVRFCKIHFIDDPQKLGTEFKRISMHFETLFGHYNKISLELKKPLHLNMGEITPVDLLFGGYDPSSHINEDFFKNKIAFHIILNFPYYSLKEKQQMSSDWTRKQWAYARLGDMFTSRVPSHLLLKEAEVYTNADAYISDYNIYAGYLVNNVGRTFFPQDMKLITHWNLRDELKSQYAKKDGILAQKMIYEVMKRIIKQEIPQMVINSNEYYWNPYSNAVFDKDMDPVGDIPLLEPDTRYEHLLNNFHAKQAVDKYSPHHPTFIQRKFEGEYEIPQEQVEELFTDFVSNPVIKKTAELIKKRLRRDLQPFDIWYDGFKARSGINEDELNIITREKYPDSKTFAADMPRMMIQLGFNPVKADFIADKITVEPSRGAGHAWGAQMRSEKAHLRTRIGEKGMDYKGYNIAVHEFGHNVEQTLTLHDVDYYMMSGVPNTAFTEAWAFIFQRRDLDLLGKSKPDENKMHLAALDNLWSSYEIMGVSLVDMKVWKWLYENPEADKGELKEAVLQIAKDVWNSYFAPVFGIEDQIILAVYSHMIDNPLYLSAYPLGHLIEFQIERHIEGRNLAEEMQRLCSQGRLIPQYWMQQAVGSDISIKPTIRAAEEALEVISD